MADWNANRLADEAVTLARQCKDGEEAFGVFVHLIAQDHAQLAQDTLDFTKEIMSEKPERLKAHG